MSTSTKDQFSVSDFDLLAKLQSLETYSAETTVVTKLGIIVKESAALTDAVTAFATAEALMGNKNEVTVTMTATRDQAKNVAVKLARNFAQKWYYNNTNALATDVLKAGLVARSDFRTIHQGGDIEIPSMVVATVKGHRFDIIVTDKVGNVAKPVNIVFIRVRYFIVKTGQEVPVDPADFTQFIDNSKHPIVLTLAASDAGLPIAISCCYVDTQGVEGGYSDVVTLNIS